MPLETWRCDSCLMPIEERSKGHVVWKDTGGRDYRDFRIVHKNMDGRTCDPGDGGGFESSMPIDTFLGVTGLADLLSWCGPSTLDPTAPPVIGDVASFGELLRRVQVPFYEEARSRTNAAVLSWLKDNELDPADPKVFRRIAEGEGDED